MHKTPNLTITRLQSKFRFFSYFLINVYFYQMTENIHSLIRQNLSGLNLRAHASPVPRNPSGHIPHLNCLTAPSGVSSISRADNMRIFEHSTPG